MYKVADYLKHAEECRRLAKLAKEPDHSAALLQMAQTWTDLAAARAQEIERSKRIAGLDAAASGAEPEEACPPHRSRPNCGAWQPCSPAAAPCQE